MSWTFFTYALAEKYIVATYTYVRTQGCLLFPTAKKNWLLLRPWRPWRERQWEQVRI